MDLKTIPEDFRVTELKHIEQQTTGSYCCYLLEKTNCTTPEAIRILSEQLHIPLKHIGYAGNKDKRAVTKQCISVPSRYKEACDGFTHDAFSLKYITHADERITLGDLDGNAFVIVVRNLEKEQNVHITSFKNYFDTQRFGVDNTNHLVGKALVQQNFTKVCELLHLTIENNDAVGAIRTLPKKTLLFYVHSYQSYLWNIAANNVSDTLQTLPLVGYLTKFDEVTQSLYEPILEQEHITKKDFLIKPMPELSVEGGERKLTVPVNDFTVKWDVDECNQGKHKVALSFTLPPGAYATMVVKQAFRNHYKFTPTSEV